MPRFEYLVPQTLSQMTQHLADYGEDAKVIAGGQSLLIRSPDWTRSSMTIRTVSRSVRR
ncbi:MAG: hypothetical protein HW398_203 [Acidobacteria bacterium]|nr:hypothetical protein [Acidobacteriota bacterium]